MVIWSQPAKLDLRQIHDFIAKDSKYYYQKVAKDIVEKSEVLDSFSEMGRVVPEINDPHIREIFIYCYRLIYQISSKKIQVLALIHSKRDFNSGNLDDLRN
jgi:toxin ParE1/3/4